MSPAVLECTKVTKYFGVGCAVDSVSLTLESGRILALVGPSGCGKTTLLRLMAGFEAPDEGSIALDGRAVVGPATWVPPEARRVGMVFQDYALFPHMTVVGNVGFGLKGWDQSGRAQRVGEVLELVGMTHMAQRYPHQLSGGEQQRVALARSLAPHPLVLLLDEPFSNLDPQLRLRVREEVKEILRTIGATVVFVTHDREEALFMGDVIAVMNAGRLEQVDHPEEVFHKPKSNFVAHFLEIADFISARVTQDGIRTEIGVVELPVQLPEDSMAEVMVRPDCVTIYPSEQGPGRVVSRLFRGMHYLYEVSLPSGAVIHSLASHTCQYEPGTSVGVSFEPDHTLTCFVNGRSDSYPGVTPSSQS